jgi:hypothetical protein
MSADGELLALNSWTRSLSDLARFFYCPTDRCEYVVIPRIAKC